MAIFDLKNPYQNRDFLDYIRKLCADADKKDNCVIEVKRRFPQRSPSQNKYLHVILGYFASQTGYSLDEVKQDWFKKHCNPDIFYRERVNQRGKTVRYLRSSADLTTAECTMAIERFRNWSAAEGGIYLPSPNEDSFLLYCEQEIEKFKEYE